MCYWGDGRGQFSLMQEVSNATEFGRKDALHKWLQKCIYAMEEKQARRDNHERPSGIGIVKSLLH